MANYPTSLPSLTAVNFGDTVQPGHVNTPGAEILAIATELGLSPSGAAATVADRLDALDDAVAVIDGGTL